MDDDQTDVKLEAGEEASISEPSPEESKASEDVETTPGEPEPTGDGETEETHTETEDAPKKGAQSRIRELNSQKKRAEDENSSLRAQIAELTGQVGQQGQQPQYIPQYEPGSEVSPEQYKQDVQRSAMSAAQLLIAQNNATNRISSETDEVIKTYPELDPESDSFDQELSDSVTEATLSYVRANPYTASPKKFVEKMMKPYKRAVTREVGKEKENIARQVSQSATRPTAVTTSGKKSDADKSIAELEAELGVVRY